MSVWITKLFGRKRGIEQEPRPVAWSAMAGFLEDLEKVGEEHGEIYGTRVRERLWEIADGYLLKQSQRLSITGALGMFSAEAEDELKAALEKNLPLLKEVFDSFGLDTEAKRRVSFLNPRLHTETGRRVDEFFRQP